jgi:hypothetical protein
LFFRAKWGNLLPDLLKAALRDGHSGVSCLKKFP